MNELVLREMLSQGVSVTAIAERFGKHPSTVRHWMAKYGLEAPSRDRHRARGGIERPRLEALLAEGLSISELASRLDRSKATVRHWLRAYELQTPQARRNAQRRAALKRGWGLLRPAPAIDACLSCARRDGLRPRGQGLLPVCPVSLRVWDTASEAAEGAPGPGGRRGVCSLWLFAASAGARVSPPPARREGFRPEPEWHHVLSLDALRGEAKKCVLLCSNCRAEVEDGIVALPDTVRGVPRGAR